ncbi:S41 family peptidase [Chitinophaga alhagiae]|uniref:S41 family peptidase n=1 Tax=Chitinophaga alhagiae TaxID=2203219 RepID=UPI000E5A17A1|nr:S41 family peptidase [Chitinophaga alhagiae]
MRNLLFLIPMLWAAIACSQKTVSVFDGSFEHMRTDTSLPEGWKTWGHHYTFRADTSEKFEGRYSLLMEPVANKPFGGFFSPVGTVPVTFTGREVTLTGYVKMENVTGGYAGLLLRIDDAAGNSLQFDNMHREAPRGTAGWTKYSITLPLPPDGVTIYAGAIYSGSGRAWIDQLELLADGKDVALAPRAKINPADVVTKGNEFNKGSKITLTQPRPAQVKDLALLCKIWGFVKYHHPAVTKGEDNWDYELFRIMPAVLGNKTAAERNAHISKWIAALGKVEQVAAKPYPGFARLLPDLDWITDSGELGAVLSGQLNEIKNSARPVQQHYVKLNGLKPVFVNEKDYWQQSSPDAGYRLLSLFRYWNIVQYFSPYRKHMDESWDTVLHAMIPVFAAAQGQTAYQVALLQLTASMQDCHAILLGRNEGVNEFLGNRFAPLEIRFMEGKAVVTAVHRDSLAIRKGDILLGINREPVKKALERLKPYVAASNPHTFLRNAASLLLRGNDSLLLLEFERNGVKKQAAVPALSAAERYAYRQPVQDTAWKFLSPEIGYVYPGTLRAQQIPDMMKAFQHTKGMVIDMRCYPRDYIPYVLGEYLMKEPATFVKLTHGSTGTPGLFTMVASPPTGKQGADYYKGQIVVLMNEVTQSRAEYTIMAIQQAPNVTTLGSPTAGADGDVVEVMLPGNIKTWITSLGVYYPDGRETQRTGLTPDITMYPTIKGFREGRDELLEKAAGIINNASSIKQH